jgi:hypothetical protein
LFTYPGKGGWTFAPVPPECAPSRSGPWGRMPVVATLGDTRWETSVWREKSGRVLLPLPKAVRGALGAGATVTLGLEFND